jgi:hypothetical protein
MLCTVRCWLLLCLVVVSLTLMGCPASSPSSLGVQPRALSLGSGETTTTFTITNADTAPLNWTAVASVDWISLQAPDQETPATQIDGILEGVSVTITVQVDRSLVPEGTSQGVITVSAGEETEIISLGLAQGIMAQLVVSSAAVDFGTSEVQQSLYISNAGSDPLNWNLSMPEGISWLSASPDSGVNLLVGDVTEVRLSVDRERNPSLYETILGVTSNGGAANVSVQMLVPSFSVDTTEIAFGRVTETSSRSLFVNLEGTQEIDFRDLEDGTVDWLSISEVSLVGGAEILEFTITADATQLPPGTHTGTIEFEDIATSDVVTVPISVVSTAITLVADPIEFGVLLEPATGTFQIVNDGDPVPFEVDIPAQAATWLSVNTASGDAVGTTTITLTADPATLSFGDYSADVVVRFEGMEEAVSVQLSIPRPAELVAQPTSVDFRASLGPDELLAIWNPGLGSVHWDIETAGFPAWLALIPQSTADVTQTGTRLSGDVSGDETDALILRIDRDQAVGAAVVFSHSFDVVASDGVTDTQSIEVSMAKPLIPRLVVEASSFDEQGVPVLTLDEGINEASFVVRNEGTGQLSWDANLEALPTWVVSIDPAQGLLEPDSQTTVSVRVDRSGLTYLGAQFELPVQSNDPDLAEQPVSIAIVVPKIINIVLRNPVIAFGDTDSIASFDVANGGDPGTQLNFVVRSNEEWVSVYPSTGSSEGFEGAQKDWRAIGVAIDCSRLDGQGATAKLIVSAFIVEDGLPVPDPSIASVEVEISVSTTSLRLIAANPRLRIPSLVRYTLLQRNVQQRPINIPDSLLSTYAPLFTFVENGEPAESQESAQMLSPFSRVRCNALILLDYSGSMLEAAKNIQDDAAISGAADPLQALYEATIPTLINEMPDNCWLSLAILNERGNAVPIRMIGSAGGEPTFTKNKQDIIDRLAALTVIDHGATELLPAVTYAAEDILQDMDLSINRIPFDDAAMRALICVTDGRLTTPPGLISETLLALENSKVQPFFIGWGNEVTAGPLIEMVESGAGQYYATTNALTDEVDAFGSVIRKPVVSELLDWCQLDDPAVDPCDQSLANDIASHVILSYVTLKEAAGVGIETRLTFDDPTDQSGVCLEDQGEISGSMEHINQDTSAIVGDVRLGQISMRTDEGLQADGSAEVIVRADYMPRNIANLVFDFQFYMDDGNFTEIALADLPALRQLNETEGGIIPASRFSFTETFSVSPVSLGAPPSSPNPAPATYRVTATSLDGTPLNYGEFGDLFSLSFTGLTGSVYARMEISTPTWAAGDINTKYFTHPDSIRIEAGEFLATSFPMPPYLFTDDAPSLSNDSFYYDLGSDIDVVDVEIWNFGGSHVPTGVWLAWEVEVGLGSVLLDFDILDEGAVTSTLVPGTLRDQLVVTRDGALGPGIYLASVMFRWNYGTVNLAGATQMFFRIVVIPELEASFNFPTVISTENDVTVTLTNDHDFTNTWPGADMDWQLNAPLPVGITLTFDGVAVTQATTQSMTPDQTGDLVITVDRVFFIPGDSPFILPLAYTTFEPMAGSDVLELEVTVNN